jgi:hypothetical protein
MVKTFLLTIAAAVALGLGAASQANAAASPTLDGVKLASVSAADVQSKCDGRFFGARVSWQASGAASGSYTGTFSTNGTAALNVSLGDTAFRLIEFDATFTIASPSGTFKGTLQRVETRTAGTGGCLSPAGGWLSATGVVYTAALPDGTIDQGAVELSLADGSFTATFHSTSRVADADLDGVVDGLDNCPGTSNADQVDSDADGLGDACDTVDDRPALFDDLVASSIAAGVPKTLVTKAQHARTAYLNSDVAGACTDLAGYIDGVRTKTGGKGGIPPATADALITKAEHIRAVIGCR